tara:strand:+ start:94 stop:678 length:585 start_codon:yes stop_codon:yes gene_type:complete
MSLIILDRQHIGKPNNPDDLGAYSEISHEHEAHLVGQYFLEIECTLRALGHSVVVISDGAYSRRHQRANSFFAASSGAALYLAGHVNAGGGSYGAVFHDHRSSMGSVAATFIAESLQGVKGLKKTKVIESKPGDWTEHAFNTTSGIWKGKGAGVCLEPFFLDCKKHKHLMTDEGLESVGHAIALGVDLWVRKLR